MLSSSIVVLLLVGSSFGELFTTLPNVTLSEFVTEDSPPFTLDKPYNSDVIVGEDVKPGSNLLLTCTASYPVQWVYTGDGRPVLSTNTSVKFLQPERKTESGLDFTAFALVSAPKEKNTGNYTCRSLQDPRVAVSYFIFVPGPNIFTSPGGQKLGYSRADKYLRIPCSVSHPRALVGLQKSVNGLLNCPLNESISYDPKTGFHLRTSDFPDPSGKYVCTAAYNGTVRYIEFNLTTAEGPYEQTAEEPSSSTTGCTKNSQCLTKLVCDQESGDCIDPCKDLCGENALCQAENHIPVCSCPPNHTGDPHGACVPVATGSNPCSGAPCGPNGVCKTDGKLLTCLCKPGFVGTAPNCTRQQCKSSRQCPEEYGCVGGYCRYLCDAGVCGRNANCRVVNQNPVCYCRPGMVGDPFDECYQSGSPLYAGDFGKVNNNSNKNSNSCDSVSCGYNADCYLSSDGRAGCRCRPGFNRGDAYTACYREEPAGPAPTSCRMSPCGPNTVCRDVQNGTAVCSCVPDTVGNPYIGCRPRTCSRHTDCNKSQMCIESKCEDPCNGRHQLCGANAVCKTGVHSYRCNCAGGFSGDPLRQCYPREDQSTDGFNPCSPNPCGHRAECEPHRGRALCRCPQPSYGDPLIACHTRCTKTAECPQDQVCYSGNKTCADPCLIYDPGCGTGAQCIVKNRAPKCVCPEGTVGDAYSRCTVKSHEATVPCYPLPCGDNAVCVLPQSSRQQGVCTCIQGFQGDPYAGCQKGDRCSNDADCSISRGCLNGRCLDPCKFQGICGINQDCIVRGHKPSCICRVGYPVSKDGNCYKDAPVDVPSNIQSQPPQHQHQHHHHQQQQPSMPTSRPPAQRPSSSTSANSCSVCGPYSDCQVSQGVIACSCKPGFIGRPPHCRPECTSDGDCAYDKACISYKCQDPCQSGAVCGRNALCRVRQRTPVCSCPKGYYGSPLHECKWSNSHVRSDFAEIPATAAAGIVNEGEIPISDYVDETSFFSVHHNAPQLLPFGNHHNLPTTIFFPLMPAFNHTGASFQFV